MWGSGHLVTGDRSAWCFRWSQARVCADQRKGDGGGSAMTGYKSHGDRPPRRAYFLTLNQLLRLTSVSPFRRLADTATILLMPQSSQVVRARPTRGVFVPASDHGCLWHAVAIGRDPSILRPHLPFVMLPFALLAAIKSFDQAAIEVSDQSSSSGRSMK